MGRACLVAAAVMWTAAATFYGPVQAAQAATAAVQPSATGTVDAHQAMVKRYCVSCHNERLKTGGLALDSLSMTDVAAGAETWEKVVRKLRTNAMPPANMPRPDAAARSAFITFLETGIDRAAAAKPFPGRTESIHRLNRAEYRNAVRDLLALDVDVESMLPADDMSYGFDNNGGVLKMTPSLLDRYMATARHVSRLAIGSPSIQPRTSVAAYLWYSLTTRLALPGHSHHSSRFTTSGNTGCGRMRTSGMASENSSRLRGM